MNQKKINQNKLREEETVKVEGKIKETIADLIGVEKEDVKTTDSFSEDFHMGSSEFVEFLGALREKGIEVKTDSLPEIETVEDLIEHLSSEEII